MVDDIITELIKAEQIRQNGGIELIPSENYVSGEVLAASGSVLTNKYSEGYPGKRYYGGQENTDKIETLAIERARKLFKADHANVQPHSGAQANEAAYHAWCQPGDTILAMNLSHGGHLTHGHPVTVLSKIFNFVQYGVKDIKTGEIDFDELRELAIKHQPKIILAGFSAYTRELDWAKFAIIGNEVGAMLMADVSHIAGLIAGGVATNPLDYGFHVLTTTTHKTLRGPRGGMILSKGVLSNGLKKQDKQLANLPTLIDQTVFPGIQGGPHMHTIAAKAVALNEASQPSFKLYAAQILKNAKTLSEELAARGYDLVFGGTDNHMILINIDSSIGINGAEAQDKLEKIGITTNKNSVPDDATSPFKPSGLRLGVPAITTIGATEADMAKLAELIDKGLKANNKEQSGLKKEVLGFRALLNSR